MKTLFNGSDPQLILFDLDGTLLDSVPDLALAVDQMLSAVNRQPAGEARVREWVGNGAQTLVKRALAGQQDYVESEVDDELFEQAYQLFLSFYADCSAVGSVLYEGVKAFLDEVQERGIKLGLITNKPIHFTLPLLETFQLADYFAIVLGGDSLSEKKPHPMPLIHAMQQLQHTPAQTLMIGDSRSDIRSAQAAGCAVAAVTYGYNHGEPVSRYQPDRVVDNLLELL
ncbi:MAG: phosphoglycolate phosphatase [Amphritea sp.]